MMSYTQRNKLRKLLTARVYGVLAPMDVTIQRENHNLRTSYGSDLHCNLYVGGPEWHLVEAILRVQEVPVLVKEHPLEGRYYGPTGRIYGSSYVEVRIRENEWD